MLMITENITFKTVIQWANDVWAKSFMSVGCLLIGLGIGGLMAESRIVSDCKFANSFRVDIQAFTCQRKI